MKVHLVGGFLGSGKTTAIAGAARLLMDRGLKVGVVTNDQGKYLVDTRFVSLADVPAVEVTGGCFCCNYSALDSRIDGLIRDIGPDVIFAESVGSCADIVATVMKPLLDLRRDRAQEVSFSVFTDIRMLSARLSGIRLPFSDEIVYIYDKQLEEAELLVLNKSDLLPEEAAWDVARLAEVKFPGRTVLLQNSLTKEGPAGWLGILDSGTRRTPASLSIDYDRYGAGEAALAWLDMELDLTFARGEGRLRTTELVRCIVDRIRKENLPVGHVKFSISAPPPADSIGDVRSPGDSRIARTGTSSSLTGPSVKISFVSMKEADWETEVPELPGTSARVLLNARVEAGAGRLRDAVDGSVAEFSRTTGTSCRLLGVDAFHPGMPRPTHRM